MQALISHCKAILSALPSNRLLAIDVFRGIAITAMILVNNPGSWQHIYAPMRHAKWHGWTLTDLIFPFFIFIVGVSITLSGQRLLAAGNSNRQILQHAAIRMFKLFLLGWFLALFYFNFVAESYDWLEQRLFSMRFMGVLQRIALVYMLCVMLWLYLGRLGLMLCFTLILLLYWVALNHIPYLDTLGNQYLGLMAYGNNLSAWLDAWLIPAKHLYYHSAEPFAFDPEGLLSTLPAVASGISGILVGQLLSNHNQPQKIKITLLVVLGLLGVLLGELWHLTFPINKALWTSSYVLLTSGYACIVLAILIWALRIKAAQYICAPFIVFGANSIAFFMFAGVLARLLIMLPVGQHSLQAWLYQQLFAPTFGLLNGSLIYALCFLAVSYLCMYWLYKKHLIWKV